MSIEFWAAQHSGQSAGVPESNAPDFNIAAVRVLGYSEFEVESINSGGIENFDWKKVKPLSASGRWVDLKNVKEFSNNLLLKKNSIYHLLMKFSWF